ncbi:SGNH hydrolase-type esterase domain-containing protein [Chytriomyces sp. MP71]|nr:SGNH hydrolase-type esterase domain-containing protein [Chytriomyces sp. MP71]
MSLLLFLAMATASCFSWSNKPSILLVGDSITQGGFNGGHLGYAALLSAHLNPSRDVYNRGYSGYTTRDIAPMFSDLLATTLTAAHSHHALVVVFLGANDAVFPGKPQHVPLARFEEHLLAFTVHLRGTFPASKLLLVSPAPPVAESEFPRVNLGLSFQGREEDTDGINTGLLKRHRRPNDRNHTVTRLYRDIVLRVAKNAASEHVGAMDTWRMMFGEDTNEVVYNRDVADSFYGDGLHYNEKGDATHYSYLVKSVRRLWPELGF